MRARKESTTRSRIGSIRRLSGNSSTFKERNSENHHHHHHHQPQQQQQHKESKKKKKITNPPRTRGELTSSRPPPFLLTFVGVWFMSCWQNSMSKLLYFRVIPTMTCWVEVVRWGLPPHNSFLLFRTDIISCVPLIRRNTWQTYLKIAATAHAQTCQEHFRIRPVKHIRGNRNQTCQFRPPEARSKVIATATGACSNMPKHVRIRPVKHIKENRKSNMSVDLLKQGQKFMRQQRRMLKSQMHCSASLEAFSAPNMPNHVRIPPVNISVG